ncbi:MAG: flagellar motor protein MotB [Lachnospiraceae bacterium]|nr:flagellar motor protein MotB [Lachnospiraceae bacterium]
MAKRKEEAPAPGSPAWMATFGDLMNLLLCFFVLLFSMSTLDEKKWQEVAASFSQTFSIFDAGATSIGDGILVSNGVSQLNELDEYINSTGRTAEDNDAEEYDKENKDGIESVMEQMQAAQLKQSEEMAELIEEMVAESQMSDAINVQFTAQYVQLTLRGALLFDSGKADIRDDAIPVLDKVGVILAKYSGSIIEIEGHTDNVPITGGRYADNSELSCARALSVFNYFLNTTNLEPSMIKYAGRGEYVPVADNSTEEGRARNRRVEIRIYNDLSTRTYQ